MSKKIYLLMVLSMVLGLLGGCQLAKDEEKEAVEGKEDKFVGVFITYREDGVFKDITDISGEENTDGKTYAKLVPCEEDGVQFHDYVFENNLKRFLHKTLTHQQVYLTCFLVVCL